MSRYPNDNNAPAEIGDVQSAIAAGAALGEPRSMPADCSSAGVFTVVPKDYKIEDLESYLPRPLRIEQDITLYDTDSFIAYAKEFMTGATIIFFDVQAEVFNAAFEYHEIDKPSWNQHIASFKPRRSVEFETWIAATQRQQGRRGGEALRRDATRPRIRGRDAGQAGIHGPRHLRGVDRSHAFDGEDPAPRI